MSDELVRLTEYHDLKARLDSLHRRQWDKKQQLRTAIAFVARLQKRIHKNGVKNIQDHFGAMYVPWDAAKYLHRGYSTISSIQKQLNEGKKKIHAVESKMRAK